VRRATSKKKLEEKDSGGKAKRSWILRLNPKGQATIPLEVRRMLGVGGECRELELRATEAGLLLLPHKPPLPVGRYVGYCAEELKGESPRTRRNWLRRHWWSTTGRAVLSSAVWSGRSCGY